MDKRSNHVKYGLAMMLLAFVFMLVSCDGGGGGSPSADNSQDVVDDSQDVVDDPQDVVPAEQETPIDRSNAEAVAGAVVERVLVELDTSGTFYLVNLTPSYLQLLAPLLNLPDGDPKSPVEFGPQDIQCEELGGSGGHVTIEVEVASPSGELIAEGNVIKSAFHACDLNEELNVDGTIEYLIHELKGDPDLLTAPWKLYLFSTMNDFRLIIENGFFFFDGRLNNSQGTDDGIIIGKFLDSDNLSMLKVKDGPSPDSDVSLSTTLESIILEQIDSGTDGYELEIKTGELQMPLDVDWDHDLPDQVVYFSSIMPFTGTVEEFPSTGEMLIRNRDDRSSVRLIVVNSETITLEIDEDGDDVVDLVMESTWEDIIEASWSLGDIVYL